MKKTAISIILLLFCAYGFAQAEASNWYFGENSGLNFNLNTNSVNNLFDGQLNTREGCASISDANGILLFYTDGITVWNKNHTVMVNGTELYGDSSSTQSAIIVPKPKDPNIYFIFTVDNFLDDQNFGLNYSIVNITLDNGLGKVVSKNHNLLRECSEKITAVLKDCISDAIWVVTFASSDGSSNPYNTFHAFEVSDLGVNSLSVKSTFNIDINDARGYLKLSPDGTKVACANASDGLYLYDFDSSSGIVSNQTPVRIRGRANNPYGVEFSPNSKVLYVHSSNDFFNNSGFTNPEDHRSTLTQFDLTSDDLVNSTVTLDDRQLYRGGLQLGPNGKIYRALSATYFIGLPSLGVIHKPNTIGVACDYEHNGIGLDGFSSQGLPPFITSFFNTEIDIIKNGLSTINLELCDGKSYNLEAEEIVGASYSWTRDNIPLTEDSFELEVIDEGHYEVYINPNNGDCALEGQAFVTYNPNPTAYDATLIQCDDDETKNGLTLFNLNEANDILTGGITELSTRFYTDPARMNQIVNPDSFSNTVNLQTVYVEVVNDNTDCFSNSELILDISITDTNDVALPAVCDDDGNEDGFHIFNLSDADDEIVNDLPSGLIITYFETYKDALQEQNPLDRSFTNTIPFSQTIFARVENLNSCYGISEVLLTVNKLPDLATQELAYYCLNIFPEAIPLNAAILDGSPISDYEYEWSTGETTYAIDVNETGTYSVIVTNKTTGCSKVRTVNVEASNITTFNQPKPYEVGDVSQNNTVTVFVSGEGIYEYALYNENNTRIYRGFQESNTFNNVFPGIYTINVKDIKNDCGTVNIPVSVIGFPKFFTPNNDNAHDTWQVYGISNMFQSNSKILIYNRYGKLIKQLDPLDEGWDGTFNGELMPSDDYWFAVTLQDGRVFKNHFTLKR
ncbi:T9SS type B sorting domain-containing protein [uncultured Algibacter sp.]|uniref:T9SS type B sorting domain-containing protein n=1 Tax=uncultured Algibacter sp. TaxID=298659 RepID=UPI0026163563|nr:T9SS type B sorting domain-containing protein [uncultured Algibacter sp.]